MSGPMAAGAYSLEGVGLGANMIGSAGQIGGSGGMAGVSAARSEYPPDAQSSLRSHDSSLCYDGRSDTIDHKKKKVSKRFSNLTHRIGLRHQGHRGTSGSHSLQDEESAGGSPRHSVISATGAKSTGGSSKRSPFKEKRISTMEMLKNRVLVSSKTGGRLRSKMRRGRQKSHPGEDMEDEETIVPSDEELGGRDEFGYDEEAGIAEDEFYQRDYARRQRGMPMYNDDSEEDVADGAGSEDDSYSRGVEIFGEDTAKRSRGGSALRRRRASESRGSADERGSENNGYGEGRRASRERRNSLSELSQSGSRTVGGEDIGMDGRTSGSSAVTSYAQSRPYESGDRRDEMDEYTAESRYGYSGTRGLRPKVGLDNASALSNTSGGTDDWAAPPPRRRNGHEGNSTASGSTGRAISASEMQAHLMSKLEEWKIPRAAWKLPEVKPKRSPQARFASEPDKTLGVAAPADARQNAKLIDQIRRAFEQDELRWRDLSDRVSKVREETRRSMDELRLLAQRIEMRVEGFEMLASEKEKHMRDTYQRYTTDMNKEIRDRVRKQLGTREEDFYDQLRKTREKLKQIETKSGNSEGMLENALHASFSLVISGAGTILHLVSMFVGFFLQPFIWLREIFHAVSQRTHAA